MKKSLIILIFLSIVVAANSQVRMGLTASPQISWLNSDVGSIKNDGSQLGFRFGLVTDLFFAERYSFSTGVIINNTGGTLAYDSVDFTASDKIYELKENAAVKYKIQYIDIPMTFKMESNKIGYFKYFAQFGVVNHIRVGATADLKDVTQDYSGVGCKDEVGLFNMSYTIGAGTLYYFSKNTAVSVGLNYTNGFLDVTDNKDETIDDKAILKRVGLSVGLMF